MDSLFSVEMLMKATDKANDKVSDIAIDKK